MDALARANEIRSQRAQLKRDLKAGRHSIQQLLLDPPEYLETAKVFDMLLAVPKYGRVKVNKILHALPDLAEQDDRRALRAPARRARLDAPPLRPRRARVGRPAVAGRTAGDLRFAAWCSWSPAPRGSARER